MINTQFKSRTKMDYNQKSLELHKKYHWKLATQSKVKLDSMDDLSTYYSPWVAAPCIEIAKDPGKAYEYTRKSNSVAVISDWSAILWLWNLWATAWLPVMEWKAILFKKFWNIDAIPLMIDTQDPDEIIKIIECIAPSFWWINLEDIAAPKCFYIESELKKRLNIPVFHDDQHWTAIVVLAGIINALKLKNEKIEDQKIIISWAWAAALAIGKLLWKAWAKNIIFSDSKGILCSSRSDLNEYKKEVLPYNKNNISWTLKDAIKDANIFIWVSKWNLLNADDIKTMATKPIVFALANPTPEITPEEAKKWWAYIIATWRWDYPNQVNNVLVFPWIFRWALDAHISQITDEHKLIAAHTLAECIKDIDTDNIIPNALQEGIAERIAKSITNS